MLAHFRAQHVKNWLKWALEDITAWIWKSFPSNASDSNAISFHLKKYSDWFPHTALDKFCNCRKHYRFFYVLSFSIQWNTMNILSLVSIPTLTNMTTPNVRKPDTLSQTNVYIPCCGYCYLHLFLNQVESISFIPSFLFHSSFLSVSTL